MSTIKNAYLHGLGKHNSGKVSDIYEQSNGLLLVGSERISCFNIVLSEAIPKKGKVLTSFLDISLKRPVT